MFSRFSSLSAFLFLTASALGQSGIPLYKLEKEGRVHQTTRVTPAMAAGVADHVWSIEEVVGLVAGAQREHAA